MSITKGNTLHRLTAKALIRDWEEASLSDDPVEHAALKRDARAAVIHLSTSYSIVSPYTSFVAVEEREEGEESTGLDWRSLVAKENIDRLKAQGFEEEDEKNKVQEEEEDLSASAEAEDERMLCLPLSCLTKASLLSSAPSLRNIPVPMPASYATPLVLDVGLRTVKVSKSR